MSPTNQVLKAGRRVWRRSPRYPHPRIQDLTAEQLARLGEYQAKWRAISRSSVAADPVVVRANVNALYEAIGLPVPEIHFFPGPRSLFEAFNPAQLQWGERGRRWLSALLWIYIVVAGLGTLVSLFFGLEPLWRLLTPQGQGWLLGGLGGLAVGSIVVKRLRGIWGWVFLGYFLVAPLAWAWSLRDSHWIWALLLGTMLLGLMLAFWGVSVLTKSRLEARWLKAVESQILAQLGTKARTQLVQALNDTAPLIQPPAPEGTGEGPDRQRSSSLFGGLTSVLVRGIGVEEAWTGAYGAIASRPDESNILAEWVNWFAKVEFCVVELGCECDEAIWSGLQTLMREVGVVLPLRRQCWLGDRPTALHLDDRQRLHAEGEPAMVFGDGSRLYYYQGVCLPERYGLCHPQQWQSQWVLEETNAEVRRVLIQGIGYGRLCQELNTKTLDTWREYELLRVEVPTRGFVNGQEVEEEAMHLLKMTCPSTQMIHVLRVPPMIRKARKAAQWVNWDIDPEAFSVES